VPEDPLLVVFHGRVFSHLSFADVLLVHLHVLVVVGVELVVPSKC
jgi:hypothetical protein